MKTKIKLLNKNSKVPIKGEPNAMCYDCFANTIHRRQDRKIEVGLGFSATPPKGYGIRLIPRSSLTKHWWVMNNSIGVGDPDYKGEYKTIFTPIPMYNHFNGKHIDQVFPYEINERCCQMEIYKREDFEFEIVDELTGEDRGGGFGSTGNSEIKNNENLIKTPSESIIVNPYPGLNMTAFSYNEPVFKKENISHT